jgi:hypothetical protein
MDIEAGDESLLQERHQGKVERGSFHLDACSFLLLNQN